MSVKLGGHGSSRENAQFYFSLGKGDLFSLIGMGMVERESVGQVGGEQKLRR